MKFEISWEVKPLFLKPLFFRRKFVLKPESVNWIWYCLNAVTLLLAMVGLIVLVFLSIFSLFLKNHRLHHHCTIWWFKFQFCRTWIQFKSCCFRVIEHPPKYESFIEGFFKKYVEGFCNKFFCKVLVISVFYIGWFL